MRVGLSTTAIFGDLSGYFFGNFRYRVAQNIVSYRTLSISSLNIDWRK